MDDRHFNDHSPGEALGALLRSLPEVTPAHDRWPTLAARAQRGRRMRRAARFGGPLALAASLALIALLVWHKPATLPASSCTGSACTASITSKQSAAPTETVAQLRARSSALEGWLHQLDAGSPPLSGTALAERVALEDQITLIDLQLDGATQNDARASLWRQRLTHLQRIALLQLSADAVAESSPNGRAPTPAVWIN